MSGTILADHDKISALRREAERLEEDAIYSRKRHFSAEDTWARRHYWLGIPATVLAVVAAAKLIKSQPEPASVTSLQLLPVLFPLVLINPLQQLGILFQNTRKELRTWARRAQRAMPLLQREETESATSSYLHESHHTPHFWLRVERSHARLRAAEGLAC